jgi:DUF1009 family protein
MTLALIFGGGELPVYLLNHLRFEKKQYILCELEGVGDLFQDITNKISVQIESLGSVLDKLSDAGVKQVCFAGKISRPKIDLSKVDLPTRPLLPKLYEALKTGDNGALKHLITIFEDREFSVIGAHEICPELLANGGVQGNIMPSSSDYFDVKRAIDVLSNVSEADIGQACIVSECQVLAVETVGGTDWMMKSLALSKPKLAQEENDYEYVRDPSLPGGGLLFKAAKTHQDLRVDMPVIGPESFRMAAKINLKGIVVKKGKVIVLNKKKCIELANKLNLFFLVVE